MDRPRVYFWEPELSPHKFPLFEAVRRSPLFGEPVYVAQRDLGESRRKQGWSVDGQGLKNVIVGPTSSEVDEIIASSPADAVHIFSGLRRVPIIVDGFRSAIRHRRRFGIFQEPRVFEGAAGFARLGESWLTEGRLRRHTDFILAVGRHGPGWFKMSGYSPSRIFPFAYFLDVPAASDRRAPSQRPRVVFLGRLETLKGAHLFMDSLEHVASDIDVRIAGAGSLAGRAAQVCEARPESRRYIGVLPMAEAGAFLQDADVLVLPSITRDDGWGAVVSEALMLGTAVIASDRVGASGCLGEGRGLAIRDLTPPAVAAAIDRVTNDPAMLSPTARTVRAAWAKDRLTSDFGASYLHAIVTHRAGAGPRPEAFV